jgi:hypothetical protein
MSEAEIKRLAAEARVPVTVTPNEAGGYDVRVDLDTAVLEIKNALDAKYDAVAYTQDQDNDDDPRVRVNPR